MDPTTKTLLTLGALFLVGLGADLVGRRTALPRVTLLLLCGFAAGPSVLDWLPTTFSDKWFPPLTDIALVMVGFLLGGNLTRGEFRRHGRKVLWISVGEVVAVALLVGAGLILAGVHPVVALLLAGIAPATAPAATMDVVRESGAEGEFTRTLLGIVAIDDAWGLIVFSLLLAAAQGVQGHDGGMTELVGHGLWEVGGAILVGAVLGVPMAYLTGRVRPGEPTQAEALGVVFVCGGIAEYLEVSYILAAMVLGAVVVNRAKHHNRPFHAIEGIEWPFMILFFILAGASLHADALATIGLLGLGYIVLRAGGLVAGSWLGGVAARAEPETRRWMGWALMPQAGVALGMALLAGQRFPEHKDVVLPVAIGATVVFELIGPVIMRRVLVRMGEVRG